MSRTGLFGRGPRVVPSLSATVLALMRQQQDQEDSNLVSAWQKGGTFDGKPATDEVMLAHWKGRLKDISKEDPLYDTYRNTVTQYEYSIAESKMTVKYAQGKVSEQGAAQFYLNWSKRIPKDSEFYRILQRDAAQHINAAKNKAAANTAKLKEEQYQNGQTATDQKYNAAGDYLTNVLTNMAHDSAIIDKNQDPSHFDLTDPQVMLNLMEHINTTVDNHANPGEYRPYKTPGNSVLFVDPQTGKQVTAKDVRAKLDGLDPHFTGTVTLDYYSNLLRQKQTGLAIMLDSATKTGHATDAGRITNEQYANVGTAQAANAWPIEEAVQKSRDTFLHTWGDANATPAAKLGAYDKYMSTLTSIANDPKRVPDPALKSILQAEVNGNANIESLATQMGNAKPGDAALTRAWADNYRESIDNVNSQKAVWTVGSYDSGTGVFTPGTGKDLGAADPAVVKGLSPIPPVTVYLPQGHGLPDMPIQVVGQTVTTKVVDPTGKAIPSTTSNEQSVGTVYNLPSGPLYGFPGPDGKTLFTRSSSDLWGPGVTPETSKDGSVTLHIVANVDANNPAFVQSGLDSNGNPTYSIHPGSVAFNPSRVAANGNPLTDSFSPTIAYRINSTEGRASLKLLYDNDPNAAAQLDREAHVYGAGQSPTLDPKTGEVAAWTGGSEAAYHSASSGASMVVSPPSHPEGRANTADDTVVLTQALSARQPGARFSTAATVAQPLSSGTYTQQLPSDASRGTAFGALARIWQHGSNNLAPAAKGPVATGPSINTGVPFVLPSITGSLPMPTFKTNPVTAPPTSTVAPPTNASPAPPYGGTPPTGHDSDHRVGGY